jgi:hypothetical protein
LHSIHGFRKKNPPAQSSPSYYVMIFGFFVIILCTC